MTCSTPTPTPSWRITAAGFAPRGCWFIGTPRECIHGCHLLVGELLARLWTRYDIDRTPMH